MDINLRLFRLTYACAYMNVLTHQVLLFVLAPSNWPILLYFHKVAQACVRPRRIPRETWMMNSYSAVKAATKRFTQQFNCELLGNKAYAQCSILSLPLVAMSCNLDFSLPSITPTFTTSIAVAMQLFSILYNFMPHCRFEVTKQLSWTVCRIVGAQPPSNCHIAFRHLQCPPTT